MTARSPRKRKIAKRGSVSVTANRGSLRLTFSYEGKQRFLALGLRDSPLNRMKAQELATKLQRDIEFDEFNLGQLDKYRHQAESSYVPHTLSLADLWQRFIGYRRGQLSPTTLANTYGAVTVHLNRCHIEGLEFPLGFRDELLSVTTPGQARDSLMYLAAACKWGVKHGLIASNPFDGMYREIKQPKAAPPVAFTPEERDRIIQAFEDHSLPGGGCSYRVYTPLVKFLFWTGCRPCEAVGLRWGSLTLDCDRIHFHESIVIAKGKLIRREETKTGINRWFTCTPKLKAFLQSLRPENPEPDALVFPSPRKGGPIHIGNFSQGPWAEVMKSLELEVKNGEEMTPYNCRDTFISLQVAATGSESKVATWVGNSPTVIRKKYLDPANLEALAPVEI
jgi:integrase